MWDVQKYISIIDTIKKNGTFMGCNVKTKEQIYELIGKAIYIDKNTVKGWARPTSNTAYTVAAMVTPPP